MTTKFNEHRKREAPVPCDYATHELRVATDLLRDKLKRDMHTGTTCPVCDQDVKLYRRKFNSNMARFLISLVREHQRTRDWVHYSACQYTGRDYPYIALWGLATACPSDTSEKRTSGLWKPTVEGVRFANAEISIPKYVYVYNGKKVKVGWEAKNERTDVVVALGDHFNYHELMRS